MDILAPLFSDERKTSINLVFRGKKHSAQVSAPLWWVNLIGPSGAGKDTIAAKLLHTGKFFLVQTATSRAKRPTENDSAYVWMRQQHSGEPTRAYLRALIHEYALFEYNFHYGNMYGTPLESIKKAVFSQRIALYCSENQGALFMEKTLQSLFNVVTIMIIPDSIADMESRILHGGRDNATLRLQESMEKLRTAQQVAHYLVKNPVQSVESGKSGLESAVTATKQLIMQLTNNLLP